MQISKTVSSHLKNYKKLKSIGYKNARKALTVESAKEIRKEMQTVSLEIKWSDDPRIYKHRTSQKSLSLELYAVLTTKLSFPTKPTILVSFRKSIGSRV